jgi:hypothetical protein
MAEFTEILFTHSCGPCNGRRIFPVHVETDERFTFVGREGFQNLLRDSYITVSGLHVHRGPS